MNQELHEQYLKEGHFNETYEQYLEKLVVDLNLQVKYLKIDNEFLQGDKACSIQNTLQGTLPGK